MMAKLLNMRGYRKFCQRGSNFDVYLFLDDEGREDPTTTISGPLRFAGVPMMAQH